LQLARETAHDRLRRSRRTGPSETIIIALLDHVILARTHPECGIFTSLPTIAAALLVACRFSIM
jgi:hypothetical protein